jgi:hypothetical protein
MLSLTVLVALALAGGKAPATTTTTTDAAPSLIAPPTNDSFSFLLLGDWGSPSGQNNVVKAMTDVVVAKNSQFIVALGVRDKPL